MLQVFSRPVWLTVAGRSQAYTAAVAARLAARGGSVRVATRVANVQRAAAGARASITLADGTTESFDAIIVATHAPDALALLGAGATAAEAQVLGGFTYLSSEVYLHRDARLMPRARAAWSAWNFLSGKRWQLCAGSSALAAAACGNPKLTC